jgi:rhodanese-related sulfurtransferase
MRPESAKLPALRQAGIICLLAAAAAGLAWAAHPRMPGWQAGRLEAGAVTVPAVLAAGPVLWVDARPAADYAADHIPGAVHVDETDWESGLAALLDRWEPGLPVVVYCDDQGCQASRVVSERLRRELGIDNAFHLKGGWQAWLQATDSAARQAP